MTVEIVDLPIDSGDVNVKQRVIRLNQKFEAVNNVKNYLFIIRLKHQHI